MWWGNHIFSCHTPSTLFVLPTSSFAWFFPFPQRGKKLRAARSFPSKKSPAKPGKRARSRIRALKRGRVIISRMVVIDIIGWRGRNSIINHLPRREPPALGPNSGYGKWRRGDLERRWRGYSCRKDVMKMWRTLFRRERTFAIAELLFPYTIFMYTHISWDFRCRRVFLVSNRTDIV